MPVVYLKNKGSKKQQRIVLIILLALLTFVLGLGIWYLRQQRIATQQEAGCDCDKRCSGESTHGGYTSCMSACERDCAETKRWQEYGKAWADTLAREAGYEDAEDMRQKSKSPNVELAKASDSYAKKMKTAYQSKSTDGGKSAASGGGGSSGNKSGSNNSCNPNYVIPVSLQSFSQTSGICFNNSTYEASYKIVVKAGNAQGECGGGYYKLTIRFPSSFGYGYIKNVQGPRITYSNGGAGVLNIRGWTYDNTSRTINISISVPKNRIQSSQFQVAATLSADDHTSGSGTKYVTSNSDGCYVPTQAQAQGGETTTTLTPTSASNGGNSGGASPGNTPPPTPEGPLVSIVGMVMGLVLLVVGILDSQYGFISRWLEAYKEVDI